MLAALLFGAPAGLVVRTVLELDRLAPEIHEKLGEAERRSDVVARTATGAHERAELNEWIQAQMHRANPRLAEEDAREYARLLVDASDKYVAVDPVFLLAVGLVESHFDARATSHASAKGLYQIYPATGEWLASELGWTYEEAMLYEPERNTELAALYLEKLFATYGDPKLVLAEYNGGPVNARRFRNGSELLASETREYVVKVMTRFRHLNARLDQEVLLAAAPSGRPANADNTLVALSLDDD